MKYNRPHTGATLPLLRALEAEGIEVVDGRQAMLNAREIKTPDEIAAVWPDANAFGHRDEGEAFLLQYGHGFGLSLWERPIISKRYRGQNQPLKKGRVFALKTSCGAADGAGAARVEEEVVITKDGCEIITNVRSDRLIFGGLPACEVV